MPDIDKKAAVRAALNGDRSVTVTRAYALDEIRVRSAAQGGDGRTVDAYAAVFDIDTEIVDQDGHYNERNAPTAFNKSIGDRAAKIFSIYNHGKTLQGTPSDQWSVPLGKPVEIKADRHGLFTSTRYNTDEASQRILEAIKSGSLTGMSYTGVFVRSTPELSSRFDTYGPDGTGSLPLVTRQEIALIEYGPTPIPAFDQAVVVGVRHRESIILNGRSDMPENESGEQPPAEEEGQTPAAEGQENTEGENPEGPPAGESSNNEGESASVSSSGRTPAAQNATPRSGAGTTGTGQTPPEPPTHSAPAGNTSSEGTRMPEPQRMTVEERTQRQSDIRARLSEIDSEYMGAELPAETRTEWNSLQTELVEQGRAIADATERSEYLRMITEQGGEGATEGVQRNYIPPAFSGQRAASGFGDRMGRSGPAAHAQDRNIWDLAGIRNRARSFDELPGLYRDNAMRAVEIARFPAGAISKEDAQTRVADLLDRVDDEKGSLALRILVTGSPLYDRAFGKTLIAQNMHSLTTEEGRALALGTDASGGFAVPFQLDPTVLLTSNGAINPLRAISRVEQITGKEWDGVTSAGVTVTRAAEATEAASADATFAQPSVRTTRVQGFVPFNIELDVSWPQLRSEMTSLLMDAKDVEEASSFLLGNGTAPNCNGLVTTLGTASYVNTAATATLAVADLYSLENALAPRFRANAKYLASKGTYNNFRQLFQALASQAGDGWVRASTGTPAAFNGYDAYEASNMVSTKTSNSKILLQGDFRQFLIVDRIGMGIELIPHLFGATNRYPTGQRGILAIWFNNSKVLVDNAFRLLNVL